MKKQYSNIDYMKLLFALAIPFLHISGGGTVTNIIAQYIARLGVPFFFCVSGFLIATQMNEQNDIQTVTNKQLWHVGKLFVLWNVLYFPFVFYSEWKNRGLLLGGIHYIREVLFRAPAYL
ncbi:MAG: acyltransferase family protein, partial [Ruthenibacterium sp.]